MSQIFITGASGTIGSAIVPRLLARPDSTLTLLLRAQDDADLQQRLHTLLHHWQIAPDSAMAARLQPVRGDISQPDFGLDGARWQAVAATTTHIIHCAASVKLTMPMAQALATAVQPTRTVLALAHQASQAGCLRKVDLVSTVGVWGRTPGRMPERALPEVQQFHNTYEAAKAQAERVVWEEGVGLPITVHRPSMVVGERDSGRVLHFQVFYHLCEFLSGARTFGIMPALGQTRLDTVPVDWVADAIAWSSHTDAMAGRILHLCSGPERAIALPELQHLVRQRWQAAGRPLPALRTVPRSWLERLIPLIGLLAGQRVRRALRGLKPVLEYLAEDQSFDNTATAALLDAAGLPLLPRERYLGPVLDYYLASKAAGGPR